MMRRALALAVLAATACAAPGGREEAPGRTDEAPESAFTPLFDGATLAGWRGHPQLDPRAEAALSAEERARLQAGWNADRDRHWRGQKGALVTDGEGVFLTTVRDYGDFELR